MRKLYLSNAFSLNMVPGDDLYILEVSPMEIGGVKTHLRGGFESAVGHEATAQLISALTGMEIPVNRISIKLSPGDIVIVPQLGARLPEGKTLSLEELKEFPIKWMKVVLREAT